MSGPNGDPQIPLGEVSGEEGSLILSIFNVNSRHIRIKNEQTRIASSTTGAEKLAGHKVDYAALDFMLDQINFCLDHLEEKNDLLHAQLQDLLESNRQARRDFQEQLSRSGADNTPQLGEGV